MSAQCKLAVLLAAVSMVLTASLPGRAQEEIFSLGFQLGPGARAIAMGGAFSSVGGDYTASFWNPAALANIRRIEVYGSLTHLMRKNNVALLENNAAFGVNRDRDEENFTKFQSLGVAYPVPTVRGSLVFSFGFNRIKTYDSNFDFRAFNQTPDDRVNQAFKEIETGGLNAWVFSGAVDVTRNISLGAGLNFWTGGTDFGRTFREVDRDDIYTFQDFTEEDGLNTDITGFNAKLGALYRAGGILRFGAAITTPVTFKVEEDWSTRETLNFDDGTFSDSLATGIFEYRIKSPWTFSGGVSLHLLNFVLAGDLEYNDWSQIEYKTEPPDSQFTQTSANRIIRDTYRATTRIRLGGEFTLPLTGLSFRAGYFRDPSVFENADPDEDKQFYSAGVGLLLDKQVKLDIAYVHGFWKRFHDNAAEQTLQSEDIGRYVEDVKINKVFISVAFRF
ncbi:MAG: hypothetical protein D6743_17215 [Calditrichaeota bacterium]|nr:MAG: hypothetical protein D6743_17215 [Calditrichota bacterium]